MSATDELRRLLDERGVEYETYDPPYPEFSTPTSDITTRWGNASYREWPNGTIRFSARGTTPEQAIEATLGRGTCHKVRVHEEIEDEMHCSECGRFLGFAGDIGALPYNFCPNCGRKVVDE